MTIKLEQQFRGQAPGDITYSLDLRTLRVNMRADGQIGTASFDLVGTQNLEPEMEVTISDSGVVFFRGPVTRRGRSVDGRNGSVRRGHYAASDQLRWLDRDVYNGFIRPGTEMTATLYDIIAEIIQQGGGTHGISVSTPETQNITGGALLTIPGELIYLKTRKQALEAFIREFAGAYTNPYLPFFYVDPQNSRLHFGINELTTKALPYSFSDDPDDVNTFGYWDFEMDDDTNGLVNAYWGHAQEDGADYSGDAFAEDASSVSRWGRLEAPLTYSTATGIPQLWTAPRALTFGRFTTKQRVLAGDHLRIYSEAWGDFASKEILDAYGNIVATLRASAVTLSFNKDLETIYAVTLNDTPNLQSYFR